MLASPKFGLHWDTLLVIPIVMVATAILGLLVALPSRRLIGDYLAIVTLFFGQFFVTVVQNGNRISFLGLTRSYDVTGGPNGIPDVDNYDLGGPEDQLAQRLLLHGADRLPARARRASTSSTASRTGRAWKSLREDPLAAELMGMPVNRLKLIAFAFGAAIAGLAGTLFAALNTAVFSADFDVPTLIIVYAMLILGGAGSLGGVILGALVVNVSLELLRTPDHATWIFYVVDRRRRCSRRCGRGSGSRSCRRRRSRSASSCTRSSRRGRAASTGTAAVGGWLGSVLDAGCCIPTNPREIGNYAFIALVVRDPRADAAARLGAAKLALIPTL